MKPGTVNFAALEDRRVHSHTPAPVSFVIAVLVRELKDYRRKKTTFSRCEVDEVGVGVCVGGASGILD